MRFRDLAGAGTAAAAMSFVESWERWRQPVETWARVRRRLAVHCLSAAAEGSGAACGRGGATLMPSSQTGGDAVVSDIRRWRRRWRLRPWRPWATLIPHPTRTCLGMPFFAIERGPRTGAGRAMWKAWQPLLRSAAAGGRAHAQRERWAGADLALSRRISVGWRGRDLPATEYQRPGRAACTCGPMDFEVPHPTSTAPGEPAGAGRPSTRGPRGAARLTALSGLAMNRCGRGDDELMRPRSDEVPATRCWSTGSYTSARTGAAVDLPRGHGRRAVSRIPACRFSAARSPVTCDHAVRSSGRCGPRSHAALPARAAALDRPPASS